MFVLYSPASAMLLPLSQKPLWVVVKKLTSGSNYKIVAKGGRSDGGTLQFTEVMEPLPDEFVEKCHRHVDEFDPSIATWTCVVGDAIYQVAFTTVDPTLSSASPTS
jgi:hypothetical protein